MGKTKGEIYFLVVFPLSFTKGETYPVRPVQVDQRSQYSINSAQTVWQKLIAGEDYIHNFFIDLKPEYAERV